MSTIIPAAGPLPEGLKRLLERFSRADGRGIAPDLAHGVQRLVQSAWDGSMLEGVVPLAAPQGNINIPLEDAIQSSTAELDAAAMAYMASLTAELNAVTHGDFNTTLFTRDVVKAFQHLKRLAFYEMDTKDYADIHGALSKHEDNWRNGPHKVEVFIVQQFCLRMVQFAESLRQRTGCRLEDAAPANQPPPAVAAAHARQESANYEKERIVGGPRWPSLVNDVHPDWAKLFGPRSTVNSGDDDDDDDDDDGPWLTPRMAAKIHHIAIADGEDLLQDVEGFPPQLPKIARPFFQNSKDWRLAFRDCYVRIGLRLQKGLSPEPNCTGEEMAFHNIMSRVPDAEHELCELRVMWDDEGRNALPKHANDEDYQMVNDRVLQDEDVLMLFNDDRRDAWYDDETNDNTPNVDNPILGTGSVASFMLGTGGAMVRACHLHPKDWFVAFQNERFKDHISCRRAKRKRT